MQAYRYRLPKITILSLIVEVVIIVIGGLVATRQYQNPDPGLLLAGGEAQWLTSSAQIAANNWRDSGYISQWQPYLERGEPAIDTPFSFVLNPISTAPSLIYGGMVGIRYSIVLYAIYAGLGGWLLGYILGFGMLPRVFLGLLLIGKGNMHAMTTFGFFQLGVTQAYLPWVLAATIAILRFPKARWAIVLYVISLTLQFWAGNIYYTFPSLIMTGLLTAFYVVHVRRPTARVDGQEVPHSTKLFEIDWRGVRRIVLALVLTLMFSAVTFLPVFANQKAIDRHPNVSGPGEYADLSEAVSQFFVPEIKFTSGTWHETYYSYVLPLWLALVLFVLLPPIYPHLYKPAHPGQEWRVWIPGLIILVYFTLWGVGQNPLVGWLNDNAPLHGQWRTVSRMLAVSSMWVAILAAMRLDGLWRVFGELKIPPTKVTTWIDRLFSVQLIRLGLMVALAVACIFAAFQPIDRWNQWGGTTYMDDVTNTCVTWLRRQYPDPDQPLSMFATSYGNLSMYFNNNVRMTHINADYHLLPRPSTMFNGDLTDEDPQFLIPYIDDEREYWGNRGFVAHTDSPRHVDGAHCIWENKNALPYAFSIEPSLFDVLKDTIPTSFAYPVKRVIRHMDRIGLIAKALPEKSVVIVQELAWPGWNVKVDGEPAKLESVGGLIGVVLPPGEAEHLITFQFISPLFMVGGYITLLTMVLMILYLLRADRFIPPQLYLVAGSVVVGAAKGVGKVLTDPNVLTPDREEDEPPPTAEIRLLPEPKMPQIEPGPAPEKEKQPAQEQTPTP